MKIISLSEAKAKLSKYANICKKEPVVVTVNGVPAFQMVPFGENDGLVERLLEFNPKFRKMLKDRLNGKFISAEKARRRIALT